MNEIESQNQDWIRSPEIGSAEENDLLNQDKTASSETSDVDTENALKCVICDKTFSLKIAFLKHLKRHSVPIIESTQGNHQKDDSPEESNEIDKSSNKEESLLLVKEALQKNPNIRKFQLATLKFYCVI